MSTVNYSKSGGESFNNHDSQVFAWTLNGDDDGQPLVMPAYADRSVQVIGVSGGDSVVIEGSNQGSDGSSPTDYFTLTDNFGNLLSFASASGKAISEMVRVLRPRRVGSAGGAVTVLLFVKR